MGIGMIGGERRGAGRMPALHRTMKEGRARREERRAFQVFAGVGSGGKYGAVDLSAMMRHSFGGRRTGMASTY